MKQGLLRGGKTVVEEVPAPRPEYGQILVQVAWSCVSPATELKNAATTSAGHVSNGLKSFLGIRFGKTEENILLATLELWESRKE